MNVIHFTNEKVDLVHYFLEKSVSVEETNRLTITYYILDFLSIYVTSSQK